MKTLDSLINDISLSNKDAGDSEGDTGVITANKISRPRMYKVLLHNDDYTTMEFVIHILRSVFNKTLEEAEEVMLEVHEKGIGVCGIYTYEIAETKQNTVSSLAKKEGHPLKCTFEAE